ncbi:DUF6308 family protein [Streptomyces sp. NPDC012510]|uniref:DUF6308 family protein n=1 Tax=Streptomyces sp. NPDC012510 TaxID=3364838 RepID=UPI0036EA9198
MGDDLDRVPVPLVRRRHGPHRQSPPAQSTRRSSHPANQRDSAVRCAVGQPPSYWLALHAALREDDTALHHQLLELRQVAGVPETVSALRVCDVAVWMNHRAVGHACA